MLLPTVVQRGALQLMMPPYNRSAQRTPPNDRMRGIDLLRGALRIGIRLWPLSLFWFVRTLSNNWWYSFLLTFADRSFGSVLSLPRLAPARQQASSAPAPRWSS